MRVDCKSPSYKPSTVEVNLAIPDIYQTNSHINYTYNKDISVFLVDPVSVPLEGGTLITVYGLNFLPTIKFKITETGTPYDISEYVSSGEFKFIAPASISTGEKEIFLTNNDQDYYQRYDYPLYYFNGIVATGVSPSKILIGSTTEITITGEGFTSTSLIKNYLRINDTIVEVTVIDSTTATAVLPSFSSLAAATDFELFLTTNLQDFYGGLIVEYILPPILSSFSPQFSNAHEAYFTINITGSNFAHSSGLLCYLGDYSSYTISFESTENIL